MPADLCYCQQFASLMYTIILYIALGLGFIPLIFLLKGAIPLKAPIAPFILLTAFSSLYEFVATLILNLNTTYWFHAYSILELLSILYFFGRVNKNKRFNSAALIVLLTVYLVSFYYWRSDNALTALAINKFPLTIYIVLSFIFWVQKLFRDNKVDNLWQHAEFYFVASLCIYYFCTAFLFIMSNYLFTHKAFFFDFWILNIICVILLRIILSVGVWKMK